MMISVIVPVYNVEKYLSKCIESIINQTYTNLEIILVDDGSTDNSGKICDNYAKKDNRIKVIHKKNGGPSLARNTGLNIFRGEYVSFIDSDDYIEPFMYDKMLQIFSKYDDIDIVSCNYNHINHKGEKIPFFYLSADEYIIDKNILIEKIFQYQNYDMIIFNKLYKRKIWQNLRFPLNIHLAEDLSILYPTLQLANHFYCIKEALYNKIQRKEGLTNSIKIEDYINNIIAHEVFLKQVKQNKNLDYKRIYIACSDNLFRHYKHLLDLIYISNDNKYKNIAQNTINKLLKMYTNNCLSNKNMKKIALLKIAPKLYKKYRILSYKWKFYKQNRGKND
ncbi:glycosyltransferase [Megamonas hypermegale]|uniref:glycosyltransferase family 2 protein n=1 Tax=Megamonas hypermegale TaxID=158847 RepID=UPI003207CD8E